MKNSFIGVFIYFFNAYCIYDVWCMVRAMKFNCCSTKLSTSFTLFSPEQRATAALNSVDYKI